MKAAIFNRIQDKKASGNDIYNYEFKESLSFRQDNIDGKECLINDKYNVCINDIPTQPEDLYNQVLEQIKRLYKEGKLEDVTVYNKQDFDIYYSGLVKNIHKNK